MNRLDEHVFIVCVSTFYDHTTITLFLFKRDISTVSLDLATARADTVASLLTQTYICR